MSSSKILKGYTISLLSFSALVLLLAYAWPKFITASDDIVHRYTIRILSYDPLLIHLEGFISFSERRHLLELGEHRYNRSRVRSENFSDVIDDYRTSDTARLPDDDQIVQRIISRASTLQGYTPSLNHESLQLTRYKAGQQYKPHWDHYHDELPPPNESQRITTIFAILEATCDECGTRFPNLSVNWTNEDARWCQFVDCNDTDGVTIRPIPGNALFWKNLNASGYGEWGTLHAGLPPLNGTKTGLNIWTREEAIRSLANATRKSPL